MLALLRNIKCVRLLEKSGKSDWVQLYKSTGNGVGETLELSLNITEKSP